MNIWADHVQTTPGTVCEDAAQTSEASRGQPGWHIGLHFRDLAGLAERLRTYQCPANICPAYHYQRGEDLARMVRLPPGSIQRLAIHCHGLAGRLFCDDQELPTDGAAPDIGLTADRFPQYQRALLAIGAFLDRSATVFLMGCIAGQGSDGTRLLNRLSGSDCWPGRTVVGFRTLGRVGDQNRDGGHCTEPGMRLTSDTSPGMQVRQLVGNQPNLSRLEWADENQPTAKVSRNGGIIRGEEEGPGPSNWFGWGTRPRGLSPNVPDPLPGDLDPFGRPTGEYFTRWARQLRAAGIAPPLDAPGTPLFWPFGNPGSHRPQPRHRRPGPIGR